MSTYGSQMTGPSSQAGTAIIRVIGWRVSTPPLDLPFDYDGRLYASDGGIYNNGTLMVTNSTFSGNSANSGGIYNSFHKATLRNTIVANSTSGGNCSLSAPALITDGGYNIEDGTSCGFSTANNFMPSTEPDLASGLANNGGPTQTIMLLKGSPAINAIPKLENGCGTEIARDQRGVSRPQGSGCEVGAFEKKVRRR